MDVLSPADTSANAGVISAADLQILVGRLTRLEDERAIVDTLHRYGQAADMGECEVWADLFVEDGVFLCVDRAGNQILREQGRPALARWLANFRANETLITKHCVLAPVVRIEGGRASVKSYLTRISESADRRAPPYLLLMGTYQDELVRCPDGAWRFESRTARTEAPLRDSGPRSGAG